MTVTLDDVCDHPLFIRLAKERIQTMLRTYYEMDNGLYTLDIKEAKEFTEGRHKHFKSLSVTLYHVADSEFLDYGHAIERSMVMLILSYGFGGFKNAMAQVKEGGS